MQRGFNRARVTILLSSALAVLAVSAAADARLGRSGEARVTFTATGPAGLNIVGTGNELQVTETEHDIVVSVPLKTLDTKIELRNRHMKEKYLEVDKYPNAELRIARSALEFPKEAASATRTVQGTLTLHGQSRPTSFTYSAAAAAGKTTGSIDVTGSLRIDIKNFGIAQPGYLGVSVKPEVDVAVSFRVQDA